MSHLVYENPNIRICQMFDQLNQVLESLAQLDSTDSNIIAINDYVRQLNDILMTLSHDGSVSKQFFHVNVDDLGDRNFDAVNVFFEHITVVEKLFKVLLYDNKDLKRVVNQIIMNFSSIYVSDIVLGDKLDMFPNFVSDLIAFLATNPIDRKDSLTIDLLTQMFFLGIFNFSHMTPLELVTMLDVENYSTTTSKHCLSSSVTGLMFDQLLLILEYRPDLVFNTLVGLLKTSSNSVSSKELSKHLWILLTLVNYDVSEYHDDLSYKEAINLLVNLLSRKHYTNIILKVLLRFSQNATILTVIQTNSDIVSILEMLEEDTHRENRKVVDTLLYRIQGGRSGKINSFFKLLSYLYGRLKL